MRFLIILLLCSQWASGQSSSKELIDRSIKIHDPNGQWHQLRAQIDIASTVIREGKEDFSERQLIMKLDENYFKMVQDTVVHEFPCTDCDRAKMYNDYFRFLLGQPMKLKDEGVIIEDNIMQKTYKGKEYNVIKVTYEPEVGTYTWLFYFDSQTSELQLTEFSKDGTFQNGETIELNDKKRYQDMLLPGQLKWFVLPDRTFLAEENITYSTIKE